MVYTNTCLMDIRNNMATFKLSAACYSRIKAMGLLKRTRGRRSGRRTKLRTKCKLAEEDGKDGDNPKHIPVRITQRSNTMNYNVEFEESGRVRGQAINRTNNIIVGNKICNAPRVNSTEKRHRIFFINPTSIVKPDAYAQFTTEIITGDVGIGLISESWMKPSRHPDELFAVDGYSIMRLDRKGRRGGGVFALVKNELSPKGFLKDRIINQWFEYFWFTCNATGNKIIL